MSKDLSELAQESFRIFHREAGPDYERLQELFNNGLGRLVLDSYIGASEQAEANADLVRQFVRSLPQVTDYETAGYQKNSREFLTSDQGQAKFLQVSTVWWRDPEEENYVSPYPYYVIGKRVVGKQASLLLQAAYSDDQIPKKRSGYSQYEKRSPLIRHTTTAKSLRAYEQRMQRQLGEPYSHKELDMDVGETKFYSLAGRTFRLRSQSPGAVSPLENFLPPRDSGTQEQADISAEEFMQCGVFDTISNLALRFKQVRATDELLGSHRALNPLR